MSGEELDNYFKFDLDFRCHFMGFFLWLIFKLRAGFSIFRGSHHCERHGAVGGRNICAKCRASMPDPEPC